MSKIWRVGLRDPKAQAGADRGKRANAKRSGVLGRSLLQPCVVSRRTAEYSLAASSTEMPPFHFEHCRGTQCA
jgi:hypothetical protein